MYESYVDVLFNLYEFLAVGGYFMCDDCPSSAEAQQAIDHFREAHGITSSITVLKGNAQSGSYWRKETNTAVAYDQYKAWNATRQMKTRKR